MEKCWMKVVLSTKSVTTGFLRNNLSVAATGIRFCRQNSQISSHPRNMATDKSSSSMSDQLPDGSANQDLQVSHDAKNSEFYIYLGKDKAVLQYTMDKNSQGSLVDLWHTGVPAAFRGRGVAKLLAQAALDHFSTERTPMRLSCTYLQKYAQDFPQASHQKFIISE